MKAAGYIHFKMVKVTYMFCIVLIIFGMCDVISSKPVCLVIRDIQIPLPSFEKISKRDVSSVGDLALLTEAVNKTGLLNNTSASEDNVSKSVIVLIPEYNVDTYNAIKCDYREEESYRN